MKHSIRFFASDNSSGTHPDILAALKQINTGHYISYGHDSYTDSVKAKFKTLFNADVEICFTYNGTGANILALSCLLRPFEGVLCSDISHVNTDECGALERHAGNKIFPVPHKNGKVEIDAILPFLENVRDEHTVHPSVLSISQITEYGTVYTLKELSILRNFAKKYNLYIHVDGARLANAAVSLDVSFEDLKEASGMDILSFGGTKNGLMFGEVVVVFPSVKNESIKFFHKQTMQLPSKMRYIAAQYDAYISQNIWKINAQKANIAAKYLAEQLESVDYVTLTQPVQANAVFVRLPKDLIPLIQQKYFFYIWDAKTSEVRWMTSFDTTKKDIDDFVELLKIVTTQV